VIAALRYERVASIGACIASYVHSTRLEAQAIGLPTRLPQAYFTRLML
jgi:hypothetical protein